MKTINTKEDSLRTSRGAVVTYLWYKPSLGRCNGWLEFLWAVAMFSFDILQLYIKSFGLDFKINYILSIIN